MAAPWAVESHLTWLFCQCDVTFSYTHHMSHLQCDMAVKTWLPRERRNFRKHVGWLVYSFVRCVSHVTRANCHEVVVKEWCLTCERAAVKHIFSAGNMSGGWSAVLLGVWVMSHVRCVTWLSWASVVSNVKELYLKDESRETSRVAGLPCC